MATSSEGLRLHYEMVNGFTNSADDLLMSAADMTDNRMSPFESGLLASAMAIVYTLKTINANLERISDSLDKMGE